MESLQEHITFLEQKRAKLRITIVEMLNHAGTGHLGGSLSLLDILISLYFGKLGEKPIMKYDSTKPGWDGQDYCILSKSHAAPAWYAVLAEAGFFPEEELKYFRQINALLQAAPSKKIPGVCFGATMPGYGLSAAIGLALILQKEKAMNQVYVLVGDGELQHGEIWEAALAAAHYKLDNIKLIIDWNDLQMDGPVRSIMGIDPIADKFESFGWKTIPVHNGHDFEDLLFAFDRASEVQRKPTVILAHTVKGKGIAFAENKASYHAEVLSNEEMAEIMPKLQAELHHINHTS